MPSRPVLVARGGVSIALLATGLSLLAGCQTNPVGRKVDEAGRYDTTSVHQLVPRDPFEPVNLLTLLDPDHLAAKSRGLSFADWKKPKTTPLDEQIDQSFAAFYEYDLHDANKLKIRRNRVQERILAGSTQRCNSFKQHLQRAYSRSNFAFGALSTITGVAGAVVPGADTAKRLAGASGLFSGLRAEWNQDFLSNLTVNVIVSGIETRQTELYRQVTNDGQTKPIDVYPVEAAVKDALFIHGQCAVISGLQVAAESIKLARDPGIENATEIMMRVLNAQKVANGEPPDPNLVQKISSLRVPSAMVGTTLKARPEPTNVVEELNAVNASRASMAANIAPEATKSIAALKELADAIVNAKCEDKTKTVHQASLTSQTKADAASGLDKELATVDALKAQADEAAVSSQLRRLALNLDTGWQQFVEGKSKPDSKIADLDTAFTTHLKGAVTPLVDKICK